MSNMFGFMTARFTDIFPTEDVFLESYAELPTFYTEMIDEDLAKATFWLLYSKYGNSSISGLDINQWTYRLWTNVFSNGPKWQKHLDINKTIRALQIDDITDGTLAIYNHAYNPATEITTDEKNPDGLITTVNDQNTTKYRRSKMQALEEYVGLLKKDPTEAYINTFRDLFLKIVEPYEEQLYETEI